jgi:peptidoglycan/xylan/chitin deacetylase (PgdA/CDA1 family)
VSQRSCMVVMYHYVRDSASTPFPQIRALPPTLFAQQLDWLQAHYQVIGLGDVEAAVDGRSSLPENAALLTFDDGFADHHETVTPMLQERGLSGVFFLAEQASADRPRLLGVHKTHFLLAHLGAEVFGRAVLAECRLETVPQRQGRTVFGTDRWEEADDRVVKHLLNYELPFEEADRILTGLFARHLGDEVAFARSLYLGAERVGAMVDAGMVFGYHTRTHRMLSRLSVSEQRDELEGGVGWVRALTGQPSVPFCYPWGGPQTYTRDTVGVLREVGYSLAFNTVRRRMDAGRDDRYELPRFDTRDLPPYTTGEHDALAAAAADEG